MFGKRKRHNRRVKEEIIMEQVMKHYGNAILAIIVLLALGAIIIAALSSDGYVATEFKNALTGFFFPHEWLNAIGRMTWGDHDI